MGHVVTGSDLKSSPTLERLAAGGVRVVVGHDAAHVADAEVVAVSTAVPEGEPRGQRGSTPGSGSAEPGRGAGRDRGVPTLRGRVGNPRQDHHHFDAGPDPGRGGPAAELPHRRRRQRDRHQRRVGHRRVARRRGRRERRHVPGARSRDRRGDQRRAGPPRLLRRLRPRRRGLRPLPDGAGGGRWSGPTTPWRRELGVAHGADLVGSAPGATYRIEDLEAGDGVSFALRARGEVLGRGDAAGDRGQHRPQRRRGGGGVAAGGGALRRRRSAPWPASPEWPAASSHAGR